MYNVGMYGGSFDPLHIGHIHNMIRAASVCKTLYIVISWCKSRDSVSKEMRYRWIYNQVKHLPNVKIVFVEDTAVSKEEYDAGDYWRIGAQNIKDVISEHIDVVFCGSDYINTGRFESLYPDSKVVYFDRGEVPISSTELRNNIYDHWQYIPPICRPYYVKRVLVIGGESTGKSTLVKNLSICYNTTFVREIGRDTCEVAGGEDYMNVDDLYENILRQKTEELKAAYDSNRIMFVDTDALTTKFYAGFLLSNPTEIERCHNLADAVADINRFDLVLFLEPTVAFVQDGTRNEKIEQNREKYSQQIKSLFDGHGIRYYTIDGDYLSRFNIAKKLIKEKLGINTVF